MFKTILIMIMMFMTTICYADNKPIYGTDGQYKGYAQDNGSQTTYYGSDGQYKGYSPAGQSSRYGTDGSYKGYNQDIGDRTNYYGSNGKYEGYSQD